MVSLPYSRSRSKWHGYRVCDVAVSIEGPVDRLEEIKKVLRGQKKFSTFKYDEIVDYDGDDESTTEKSVLDSDFDTKNALSQDLDISVVDNTTRTLHTHLLCIDDTTPMSTQPIGTPLKLKPKATNSSTSSETTTPPARKILATDSDTTPIVSPPKFERYKKLHV